MEEFRFKNKSDKYFIYPLLLCVLIDTIISYGFYRFKDDVSFELSLNIFKTLFVFSSILYKIPLILIFLNHQRHNSKKSLSLINKNGEKSFIIRSPKETIELSYEKIERIDSFLSFPRFDKRMSWMFWDNFFYYRIVMSDGVNHPISCLICDNLFLHIEEEKNVRHKILFPIIFRER
jgi:hypothetical protein